MIIKFVIIFSMNNIDSINSRPQLIISTFAITLGITAFVVGLLSLLGSKGIIQVGALGRFDPAAQFFLIAGGLMCTAVTSCLSYRGNQLSRQPQVQPKRVSTPTLHPPLSQTHPQLVNRQLLQAKDSWQRLPAPALDSLTKMLDPQSVGRLAGVSRHSSAIAGAMKENLKANNSYWEILFAREKISVGAEGELPPYVRYEYHMKTKANQLARTP